MLKRIAHLTVVLLCFWSVPAASVGALSQDQLNIYNSGIYAFDTAPGTATCSATLDINLSGNSNPEKAYNFFISQGLGAVQAAAIVGNFYYESSGVIPTTVGGGGNSDTPVPGKPYGIAQWLGVRVDGTDGLENFASQNNSPINQLDTQLNFSWHEFSAGNYQKALSDLKQAQDIPGATNVVFQEYEGPNDSTLPKRTQLAQQIYQQFSGDTGSTNNSPVVSGCSPVGPGQDTQYVDGFTVYSQYDPAWANLPYGTSTIAASGCGPSAMAMIITALTGQSVTPDITAAYAASQNLYIPNEGSSWSIAPKLAQHWGLQSAFIGASIPKIAATLQTGGLVIVAGEGPVPFTTAGHFIVIRGVATDGNWLIGDSAHGNTSTQEWSPEQLIASINDGSVYAISK